ncbi:DUF397 domain-containing protein [Streptomyces sp. NPDC020742]|uniref:DUF397 domain-containing protein n=1 Tax=unclassified Streptomyces TaxID=2593676 RepID=UPI0034111229
MIAFEFHKSSYSSSQGECVEVAHNVPGVTAVRDSKNPDGPHLVLGVGAWASFIAGLKAGDSASS